MFIRRSVAVSLCLAILLSLTGCSANRENVITWAGYLGSYVVERDYVGLLGVSTGEDPELEEMMFIAPSDDIRDQINNTIASTMSYKVIEESFKGGWSYKIDIDFQCVDYISLTADGKIYQDIDEFRDAVNGCANMIDTVVTLDFENRGGQFVCTDISALRPVFDFTKAEINIAGSLSEFAGDISFGGDQYDEEEEMYFDTERITCEMEVNDLGHELTWDYFISVSVDGNPVYYSDIMSEEKPERSIPAVYDPTDTEVIPAGEYEVTFYDINGEVLASSSVSVDCSTDLIYVSEGGAGDFVCPPSRGLLLPDTDIVYFLPEGFSFRNSEYGPVFYLLDQGDDTLVAYADRSLEERNNVMISYIPLVGADSDEAYEYGEDCINVAEQDAIAADIDYYISTDTIDVGDYEFTVWYIDADDPDGGFLDCAYIIVGNSEVAYLIGICGEDMDQVNELIDDCLLIDDSLVVYDEE